MEAHIKLFSDANPSKSLAGLQQNKPTATKLVVLLGNKIVVRYMHDGRQGIIISKSCLIN